MAAIIESPNENSFGRPVGPNQGARPTQQGYGQMPSLASTGAFWNQQQGRGGVAPWQMGNKQMGYGFQQQPQQQPQTFQGGQPSSGGSMFGQPQTPSLASLTPQYQPGGDVFSGTQTQVAQNQIRADADQASALPWLMKRFGSPGVSQSAGHAAAAMPLASKAHYQGEQQAGQLGLSHQMANAQQKLQDETMGAQNAMGGLDLWRQIDAANKQYGQANRGLLSQVMLG
jgi:hypothetical protein